MARKKLPKLKICWKNMRARCYNPNNKYYKNYGGRGIEICEEWLSEYEAFERWAYDNGYQDGLTIDRIDNNGNYEPANCRWATMKEQNNNRRDNRLVTYEGKTQTLRQWADELGVDFCVIRERFYRGAPAERIYINQDLRATRKLPERNPKGIFCKASP